MYLSNCNLGVEDKSTDELGYVNPFNADNIGKPIAAMTTGN